jgi:hypothetical protein
MVKQFKENVKVQGGVSKSSAEGTTHSLTDSERIAFCDWMNSSLEEDKVLNELRLLPVDPNSETDLFKRVENGILLWYVFNSKGFLYTFVYIYKIIINCIFC